MPSSCLHSICQQFWKTPQRPQDWKMLIPIPIPKKGSTKECVNHRTVALISMLVRSFLKSYTLGFSIMWTKNFQMSKLDLVKDQIANIHWIIEKARNSKQTHFCFTDYPKPLTVWIIKNWKVLKEIGMQDHVTCLLRNLYTCQEAETDAFLELSCFLIIQRMLEIWSIGPLPFLKPAWTYGSLRFKCCWILAWRILSITWVACEMSAIVW